MIFSTRRLNAHATNYNMITNYKLQKTSTNTDTNNEHIFGICYFIILQIVLTQVFAGQKHNISGHDHKL